MKHRCAFEAASRKSAFLVSILAVLVAVASAGREIHVSTEGDDANDGSTARPLRTLSAAACLAQPGDTVTVYAGLYRERIDPPRGGAGDDRRIVYQAAPGEHVEIRGSEPVGNWERVVADTWKTTLPNSFFGDYNPYADLIAGDWFNPLDRSHHTGAVYLNGVWLDEAKDLDSVMAPTGDAPLWFGEVGEERTTLWAQFRGVDPNAELVEVNVRPVVFYPSKTGIDYLTVRGFTLRHAATQWAPPTAEQPGLVGTHWSKGWIIENNTISHSRCVGIALGKYSDAYDNVAATADAYNKTVERALEKGWSKEKIGSHIVRNNHISHCEQAGIVGSLGAAFSTVTGNTIHDIHVKRLFTGAEMAGIKFHAAIDTLIANNHIFHTTRGIWLDWMTQGTRVTGNLVHGSYSQDLFAEVNHGPFLVDNNLFLSEFSLDTWSEGGAFCHNLFAGRIARRPVLNRATPYHTAHSTEVQGISVIEGGDDRFYNNIILGKDGLAPYDDAVLPVRMGGNVFLGDAKPSKHEPGALVASDANPGLKLFEQADGTYLDLALDATWATDSGSQLATTELLGIARIPGLPYVQPDNAPIRLDTDYSGNKRNEKHPFPGPFALPHPASGSFKVWPRELPR